MLHRSYRSNYFSPTWIGTLLLSLLIVDLANAHYSPDDFIVKGVSGNNIVVNQRWDRGCVPGFVDATWTRGERTIIGLELVVTLMDYHNKSTKPDCTTGLTQINIFVESLISDNILVPTKWVDIHGKSAKAPRGLKHVYRANGVTVSMTRSTVTLMTRARADYFNQIAACDFTDWEVGMGKDVTDCVTGGVNPSKGTIVVDDRKLPWKVYDNFFGGEVDLYPTQTENTREFLGPLPLGTK
ncbi:hypothetical protein CRENPOLYSF2_3370011 [Crenothrix polyspora]|uniref:Uncharacterized protein n=1 Tax=Crenothrix polyspora TaxID=360316 RepID=A0A1R4HB85_9GAMM|nr:hypothetical protein [Crenothrix polyspora]SJM93522.1 hypothetical protein CRENPOLYSF2_3370011 [Crenothrix polyspora]